MSVAAYIIFVNEMLFVVSISIHVRFTTVKHLEEIKMVNISKYLVSIYDVYYRHGMYAETFYMNKEFENTITRVPVR